MKHALRSGPEPHYDRVVSGYETFHSRRALRLRVGRRAAGLHARLRDAGGRSRRARDNAILLHTGLSASSHAKSHPRNPSRRLVGALHRPGRAARHRPLLRDLQQPAGRLLRQHRARRPRTPRTGEPWATDFPILTVSDMVRAQLRLLDHLGIERLHASVGASLGGMQSLALAALAPERVARLVSISAALRAYPQSIALRFVQRQAVMADPDWRGGRYYGESFPHRGQKHRARDRHDHLPLGPGVAGALRPRARRRRPAAPRRGLPGRALPGPPGRQVLPPVRRQLVSLHLEGDGPLRPARGRSDDGVRDRADPLPRARDRRDDGPAVPGLAAARAGRGAARSGAWPSTTSSSTPPTATTPS